MHPIALLRYLLLPLHASPLILIVLFGLGMTAGEHMGVYGIFIFTVLGSWFFKYSFALLDHVVDGRAGAPVLSPEMANPVEQRPLGFVLLLVAVFSFTRALQPWLGDAPVFVLRCVFLALTPAMVAVMSVTGQFIQALNPRAVFGAIARIPFAYVLLLLVIGSLWFVPVTIVLQARDSLSTLWRGETFLPGGLITAVGGQGALIGLVAHMLFMYLWLAMFACVGGTIYERRHDLGVEPAEAPERIEARHNAELERERDKTMDRIFAELRGGALGNAGRSVRRIVDESSTPMDECRWLYARAKNMHPGLANYVAQLMLTRLVDAHANGEALRVLQERLLADPQFRPQTAGETVRLAQLARVGGDRITARALLADFERHFPNDAMSEVVNLRRLEMQR